MKYDLHNHSYFSDGELSPEALVHAAQEAGIDVLALTDHDTVDGLPRARLAAKAEGVVLVPGVEISSRWERMDIHVLGLGIDTNNATLMAGLHQHQQERVTRAQHVAAKLEKLGFNNIWQEVSASVSSHYIGRPDFARVLVNRGEVKDFQSAFHKYLGEGKLAYVATEWASVPEAVSWIKSAQGLAVLAHPGRYRMTRSKLLRLISCFKEAGGDGLEVLYPAQDADKTRDLAVLAKQFGLLASAGSDFHGLSYPGMKLGMLGELPTHSAALWDSEIWSSCLARIN